MVESGDSVTTPMTQVSLQPEYENKKVRENNTCMYEAVVNSHCLHCYIKRWSLLSAFQEGVAVVRVRYPLRCVIH